MDFTPPDTAKVLPVVGINSLLLLGLSLADWVLILNFTYIAILLAQKLWHLWKAYNGRKQ